MPRAAPSGPAGPIEPTFVFTVKQVIWTVASTAVTCVVTLVVTAWVLWTFTMGNLQADVKDIRETLSKTQDGNAQTRQIAESGDTQLKGEFASLTAELRVTNDRLQALSTSVSGLDTSIRGVDERIKAVDGRLIGSIHQQTSFERWVVLRLGPAGMRPTSMEVPAEWRKQQDEIFPTMIKGDDPFLTWYKATSDQP